MFDMSSKTAVHLLILVLTFFRRYVIFILKMSICTKRNCLRVLNVTLSVRKYFFAGKCNIESHIHKCCSLFVTYFECVKQLMDESIILGHCTTVDKIIKKLTHQKSCTCNATKTLLLYIKVVYLPTLQLQFYRILPSFNP